MSLISKRDIGILLEGGFSKEDLGLVEGGVIGVELYETPDDYFVKELIENACESGECSLYDEPISSEDRIPIERYDTSRKARYEDNEYCGSEDWLEDVPVNVREQAMWLKNVKLGRVSVWQRKNNTGTFEWKVNNLRVEIGDDDKERFKKLSKEDQKILWTTYAREEWKHLWEYCVSSLKQKEIEFKTCVKTKRGFDLNILAIPADNVREAGYDNLPAEAKWITMIYFDKNVWKH